MGACSTARAGCQRTSFDRDRAPQLSACAIACLGCQFHLFGVCRSRHYFSGSPGSDLRSPGAEVGCGKRSASCECRLPNRGE